MVPLAAGLVVLVHFPFSDLSRTKLRPAVVLADAAAAKAADFERGSLLLTSYARPGKLFTASGGLVERVAGVLQPESLRKVITAVVKILGDSR